MKHHWLICLPAWLCLLTAGRSTSIAADDFTFVVATADESGGVTDFSHLSTKPAGSDGFVRIVDGHFATDAGRLRIWGVNLAFGANFPHHADAEKAAAQIARLGINAVRLHHFETQIAPRGLLRQDGTIDPDQMDRLNYFLNQLHKRGIYANLNLHVGQTPSLRLGLPQLSKKHYAMNDKHALHFQPEIQEAMFAFWRAFLTHENPYRGLKRVDDPGIALLEISNENRFVDAGPSLLLTAPEPYRSTILKKWNEWLRDRYGDSKTLQAAWRKDENNTATLPEGQSIKAANVAMPDKTWSDGAQTAFTEFMQDTETAFYRKAKRFLVDDLGARVPITTTQANYQPAKIVREVADFADMHAYWHHPIFHGTAWSGNDWTVQNEPLVEFPFHNKWPRCNMMMRTAWRIHDMPFTFGEWNAGQPSAHSAGAIPLAALLAGLQDWDAIFFYSYHGKSDAWDADRIQGHFHTNGHPCKTVLLPVLAPLFRRADLQPLKEKAVTTPDLNETLGSLAFQYRVGVDPNLEPEKSHPTPTKEELTRSDRKYLVTPDGSVKWDARDPRHAHITINRPATRAVWGRLAGSALALGSWQLKFGEIEPDYAIVVATSHDGKPLESALSILIAAVGHAENQKMGWNEEHTSVGEEWGTGPTWVNGIPFELRIPMSHRAKRLFALDGQGKRIGRIPLEAQSDGTLRADLGPQWKTLWYELSAKK